MDRIQNGKAWADARRCLVDTAADQRRLAASQAAIDRTQVLRRESGPYAVPRRTFQPDPDLLEATVRPSLGAGNIVSRATSEERHIVRVLGHVMSADSDLSRGMPSPRRRGRAS